MKFVAFSVMSFLTVACTSSVWVERNAKTMEASLSEIRDQGISCAPKEMAYAEAHLVFAKTASADGRMHEAKEQIDESKSLIRLVVSKSTGAECDGDRDGDGLVDSLDQCPDIPEDFDNQDDNDGCPEYDRDGDSIPDDRDQCPTQAEDKDKFRDQDGCPDPDNDEDGLLDQMDQCPNRAEDVDDFEDLDGCPDIDNDKDGIRDDQDDCPSRPGPKAKRGCPEKYRTLILRAHTIVLKRPIAFKKKTADWNRRSHGTLIELVRVMKRYPSMTLRIDGYAAKRRLARKRARAIMNFLIKKKIERSRLAATGEMTSSTDEPEPSVERIELHIELP